MIALKLYRASHSALWLVGRMKFLPWSLLGGLSLMSVEEEGDPVKPLF